MENNLKELKDFWVSHGLSEKDANEVLERIILNKQRIFNILKEHPYEGYQWHSCGDYQISSRLYPIQRSELDELGSELDELVNCFCLRKQKTVKELTVTITGGNLRDGEYMVRRMTPEQIYETLRDGFTVKANGQS